MAKKVTFDNLPAMVEKMLEILTAEGSEHTATPEILQRVKLLEKKLDSIERLVSPDRPVMDKQMVLRLLKIRPKQLSELEITGVLMSHKEGRSTVFYEDDVMRCYAKQFTWKNAIEQVEQPATSESAEPVVPAEHIEPEAVKPDKPVAPIESEPANAVSDEPVLKEDGHLIYIDAAAAMIGRSKKAVHILTSKNQIPYIKKGGKLAFDVKELEIWLMDNPPGKRKRKPKVEGIVSQDAPTKEQEFVDIHGASEILGRTPGAIRQHLSSIPHEKVGRKLYFYRKELERWAETHRPRKRKQKPINDEAETT